MHYNLQHSHANTHAGVTEVVLPRENQTQGSLSEESASQESPIQLAMVLPMLAHLSRQTRNRWFSWIAPKGISRQMLKDYDFDLSKVRLIHTRDEEETLWVLWQALAQGNSEAVVASPGKLSDKALTSLEQAAWQGNTQGLLIRYR